MKHRHLLAAIGAMIGLAGCASPQRTVLLPPLGPAPTASATGSHQGALQVYSAREPANVDLLTEDYFWNNDFGRNDFLFEPAHTDYRICAENGQILQTVRNARNLDDAQPTRLMLSPGHYRVQAKAREDGTDTLTVTVPVVIEPGKTTVVHLDGDWRPFGRHPNGELVRLPNGNIAGWPAQKTAPGHELTKTSGG